MEPDNICMHLLPCLTHLVNDSDLPVDQKLTHFNFVGQSRTCDQGAIFGRSDRQKEIQRSNPSYNFIAPPG